MAMDDHECENWCSLLTTGSDETEDKTYGGIFVQLNGDLHRLLALQRVRNVSKYALLTTHSAIPRYKYLSTSNWSATCHVGGQNLVFSLKDTVIDAVSCCGPDSLMIEGGSTSVLEHRNKKCGLGFNFTLLLLNEEAFIPQIPHQCNPPTLLVPNEVYDLTHNADHLAKLMCPQPSNISEVNDTHETQSQFLPGKFYLICRGSLVDESNDDIRIPIKLSKVVDIPNPKSLKQKIERYEILQRIYYTCETHAENLRPGLPIVCLNNDGATELIGIHTDREQDGRCVGFTIFGLLHLLHGGPVPCLSLLKNHEAQRIWLYKWAYLMLPHLAKIDIRHALETIQMLKEHVSLLNKQDPPQSREAFFKLLGALFSHFRTFTTDELSTIVAETFDDPNEFYDSLKVLCKVVTDLTNDISKYETITKDVKDLAEACFCGINVILNCRDQEGIVEKALKSDQFLETLKLLRLKFTESATIQSNLADIYQKCYEQSPKLADVNPLREKCTKQTEEINKLQSDLVHTEGKCKDLQRKLNQKEEHCNQVEKLLVQERTGREHLQCINNTLQQQLASERSEKEREHDSNVILAQNLQQAKQSNEEAIRENQTLCDKVSTLESTVHSLEQRNKGTEQGASRKESELAAQRKTIHNNAVQIKKLEKEKEELEKSAKAQADMIAKLEKEKEELEKSARAQADMIAKLEKEKEELEKSARAQAHMIAKLEKEKEEPKQSNKKDSQKQNEGLRAQFNRRPSHGESRATTRGQTPQSASPSIASGTTKGDRRLSKSLDSPRIQSRTSKLLSEQTAANKPESSTKHSTTPKKKTSGK